MDSVILKFVDWWKSPSLSKAHDIFHDDLYYRDCALGNAKDLMLMEGGVNFPSDLKLIKCFSCVDQGLLIFEETDEITKLYYRRSFYFKFLDGEIVEVIATKESVANEAQL